MSDFFDHFIQEYVFCCVEYSFCYAGIIIDSLYSNKICWPRNRFVAITFVANVVIAFDASIALIIEATQKKSLN